MTATSLFLDRPAPDDPHRAAPRGGRAAAACAPPRAARAGPAPADRRRPEPVGPVRERLGQRVLQRRRALDELELARVPLWLVRRVRGDDGRQAAARLLGPGGVREGVRLPLAEPARAAGADGRRDGRARLRPDAPPVGPPGRLRRGPRARHDADRGRDLAPQQPGRAADPLLRRSAVGDGPRAAGRPHALDRARGRLRRPRLRDQDGGGAAGRAGDRRGLAVDRPARAARRAAPAAGGRGGDGRRRRRVAAAGRAHPRGRPPVGLGHERQLDPLADLRLQRPRPPRRPGRRPAGLRRRRGWGRRPVRRPSGCPAAARLLARRAGGLAARLRPRRRARHRGREPPPPGRRAHRLADRRRRRRADLRGRLQRRLRHLPSVLRLPARSVRGRPRRRRRGAGPQGRAERAADRRAGHRGRRRHDAGRAPQQPRPAGVAAAGADHRRRAGRRRDRAARRPPPPDQPRRRPRRAVHRARRVGDADARPRHPGDLPRGRADLRVGRRLRRRRAGRHARGLRPPPRRPARSGRGRSTARGRLPRRAGRHRRPAGSAAATASRSPRR